MKFRPKFFVFQKEQARLAQEPLKKLSRGLTIFDSHCSFITLQFAGRPLKHERVMLRRALTARISAPFRSARVLYSKPATVTALNQVRRGITTYSNVSNPATAKALTAGILTSVSLSFLYAAKLNALEPEGSFYSFNDMAHI